MKQDIENIIKKNLPEKKEVPRIDGKWLTLDDRNDGFNQALSQINTSLIADEVLKVVVESMQKYKKSWNKDICGACGHKIYSNHNFTCDCLCKVYREVLEDLLSNLSPNKDNE